MQNIRITLAGQGILSINLTPLLLRNKQSYIGYLVLICLIIKFGCNLSVKFLKRLNYTSQILLSKLIF